VTDAGVLVTRAVGANEEPSSVAESRRARAVSGEAGVPQLLTDGVAARHPSPGAMARWAVVATHERTKMRAMKAGSPRLNLCAKQAKCRTALGYQGHRGCQAGGDPPVEFSFIGAATATSGSGPCGGGRI